MLRILPLLAILLTGCITSMKVDPQSPPMPRSQRALDLSGTLGEVQQIDQGVLRTLTEQQRRRIASDFEGSMRELHLVREIKPPGQPADLIFDLSTKELDDFGRDTKIGVYQGLLVLPALFLPIPFPYQMEYRDSVRVKTQLKGVTYPVREYDANFVVTIWGLSVWAPLFAEDTIQQGMMKRAMPVVGDKMIADYPVYERVEEALRAKDEQALRKLHSVPHPTAGTGH